MLCIDLGAIGDTASENMYGNRVTCKERKKGCQKYTNKKPQRGREGRERERVDTQTTLTILVLELGSSCSSAKDLVLGITHNSGHTRTDGRGDSVHACYRGGINEFILKRERGVEDKSVYRQGDERGMEQHK